MPTHCHSSTPQKDALIARSKKKICRTGPLKRKYLSGDFKFLWLHTCQQNRREVSALLTLGALGHFQWVSEFSSTESLTDDEGWLCAEWADCAWNSLWIFLGVLVQGGRDPQSFHILPKTSESPSCTVFPSKHWRLSFPTTTAHILLTSSQHPPSLTESRVKWTWIRIGVCLERSELKDPAY